MTAAIKLAIDALEAACGNRCNAEYNPCQAREAIAALRAQPTRVPVALSRDDTEHGVYYYRADEVDALLMAQPAIPEHIRSIKIPTDTMEQELQNHYRRGYEAGRAAIGEAME